MVSSDLIHAVVVANKQVRDTKYITGTMGKVLERLIQNAPLEVKERLNDLAELASEYDSSPKIKILRQKHALNKVIDKFEATKAELTQRIENYDKRQSILSQKQKDMVDQVEKFEQFIMDNDEKVKRASDVIRKERSMQKEKQDEIIRLRLELHEESKRKDEIASKLEKIYHYKEFVSLLDDDIESISKRSRMLQSSNEVLHREIHDLQYKTEEIQATMPSILSELSIGASLPLDEVQYLQEKLVATRSSLGQELDKRRSEQKQEINRMKERSKLILAIRQVVLI